MNLLPLLAAILLLLVPAASAKPHLSSSVDSPQAILSCPPLTVHDSSTFPFVGVKPNPECLHWNVD